MAALGCPVMTRVEGTFLPEVGPCHLVGPVADAEQVGNPRSLASPASPSLCLPFQKFLTFLRLKTSV